MAESFPQAVSDRADDAGQYQPLAPLAIAATVVAGLLALATATLLIIGLIAGKRVLEFGLILGAIAGVGLSIAARWQIRRSQGARTGTTMANVSWWTSLICGLAYGAYYLGTLLSIRAQAQEFLDETWYKALNKQEVDKAFFYTQTPVDRRRRTEHDVIGRFPEQYAAFRRRELAHVVERAKGEITIEPKGFAADEEKQQTVTLAQAFEIRSREGWFRFGIGVVRSTSKDFEGVQYHIPLNTLITAEKRLSTYGRVLRELSQEGGVFAQTWMAMPGAARFVELFLLAQDLTMPQRQLAMRDYFVGVLFQNSIAAATTPDGGLGSALRLAATTGDTEINRKLHLPPAFDTYQSKLISIQDSREPHSPATLEQLRKGLLRSTNISPPMSILGVEVATVLEIGPDYVRVGLPGECMLPQPLAYGTELMIFATLRDPKIMAEINRLKQMDWQALADQEDKLPGSLLDRISAQRNWTITAVKLDLNIGADTVSRPGMKSAKPGGSK